MFRISKQFHCFPALKVGMSLFNKESSPREHFLIKINLKEAYFHIPLHEKPRKCIRCRWERTLNDLFCLCFSPAGSSPVVGQTPMKIIQAKETLLYLLKNLLFVVNVKKTQLTLAKEVKVLGLITLSKTVTLALS